MTKPFRLSELLSRISGVLRRTSRSEHAQLTANTSLTDGIFEFLGTEVDPSRLKVRCKDVSFEKIGHKEFGILSYLANNPHLILSRKSIIPNVWREHVNVKSRSLDQYSVKLRKMLSANDI
jgi:DNA-binding response OmpR family regulator